MLYENNLWFCFFFIRVSNEEALNELVLSYCYSHFTCSYNINLNTPYEEHTVETGSVGQRCYLQSQSYWTPNASTTENFPQIERKFSEFKESDKSLKHDVGPI